jgi:hypothetical protein
VDRLNEGARVTRQVGTGDSLEKCRSRRVATRPETRRPSGWWFSPSSRR